MSSSRARSAKLRCGVSGWATLIFAALVMSLAPPAMSADGGLGAFGPEGTRMREQLWLLPSTDSAVPLRATLFRPGSPGDEDRRLPLVVISHGTDEGTRLAVSMPVYYWLSRWFVERGYAVLLPQRRGHGATGGPLAEAIGTCGNPDHYHSGLVAARDLAEAIKFMSKQPFIAADDIIAAGISTGGWASLALASIEPSPVRAVVSFAGGRGGHAYGRRNVVCGHPQLVTAAGAYAKTAHVPTLWFYAQNDSYFSPKLAEELAQSWSGNGGQVEARILPPYGTEGHNIADDLAGWDLWGPSLDRFLTALHVKDAPAVASAPPVVQQGATLEATKVALPAVSEAP